MLGYFGSRRPALQGSFKDATTIKKQGFGSVPSAEKVICELAVGILQCCF